LEDVPPDLDVLDLVIPVYFQPLVLSVGSCHFVLNQKKQKDRFR
jgi:hypothetical protein